MAREAAIVSTARTPIGKAHRGAFNATMPDALAAHAMNAAIERAGIEPERIDDIYYGTGNQYGPQFYNIGRMSVFTAGLPQSIPAFSLSIGTISSASRPAAVASAARCWLSAPKRSCASRETL